MKYGITDTYLKEMNNIYFRLHELDGTLTEKKYDSKIIELNIKKEERQR